MKSALAAFQKQETTEEQTDNVPKREIKERGNLSSAKAVFERGDQEEEVVQPKREIKERGNLSSARGLWIIVSHFILFILFSYI